MVVRAKVMIKRINGLFVTQRNWTIFVLFVCMHIGLADSEDGDGASEESFHVHTNRLSEDDASNYGTQLPPVVGDIVYEADDDDQNNYDKLSNHVAKFSNQPPPATAFRSIDGSDEGKTSNADRQRHTASSSTTTTSMTTSHVNGNKWMDRLIGHKRWADIRQKTIHSHHGHHHNLYQHHHHHHHHQQQQQHHNHRKHKAHSYAKQLRGGLKKHRYSKTNRNAQNIDGDESPERINYDKIYETNHFQSTIVRPDKWHILPKITAPYRPDEDSDLPPYLKKYNKRNRQLINLLEGTLAPPYELYTQLHPVMKHKHHHKKTKWLENNLFEEQRPHRIDNATMSSNSNGSDDDRNRLPGENDFVESMARDSVERKADVQVANGSSSLTKTSSIVKSSKNDKFVYHRVASPKLVGAGSYGLLRKQRLPFVAITDKRIGHPSNRAYTS